MLVLVVLSSTARTKDVLYTLRTFVKSSLGNCLFYFGLQGAEWLAGVKGYMSLGSLSLILTSFILSTMNLFTRSNWSICFAGCSIQNSSLPETLILLLQLHF